MSDAQLAWLGEVAAGQNPPLSTNEMLVRIVDQAIVEGQAAACRRVDQLEIYRASGYPEHHPDYPGLPRGPSDV